MEAKTLFNIYRYNRGDEEYITMRHSYFTVLMTIYLCKKQGIPLELFTNIIASLPKMNRCVMCQTYYSDIRCEITCNTFACQKFLRHFYEKSRKNMFKYIDNQQGLVYQNYNNIYPWQSLEDSGCKRIAIVFKTTPKNYSSMIWKYPETKESLKLQNRYHLFKHHEGKAQDNAKCYICGKRRISTVRGIAVESKYLDPIRRIKYIYGDEPLYTSWSLALCSRCFNAIDRDE